MSGINDQNFSLLPRSLPWAETLWLHDVDTGHIGSLRLMDWRPFRVLCAAASTALSVCRFHAIASEAQC